MTTIKTQNQLTKTHFKDLVTLTPQLFNLYGNYVVQRFTLNNVANLQCNDLLIDISKVNNKLSVFKPSTIRTSNQLVILEHFNIGEYTVRNSIVSESSPINHHTKLSVALSDREGNPLNDLERFHTILILKSPEPSTVKILEIVEDKTRKWLVDVLKK